MMTTRIKIEVAREHKKMEQVDLWRVRIDVRRKSEGNGSDGKTQKKCGGRGRMHDKMGTCRQGSRRKKR